MNKNKKLKLDRTILIIFCSILILSSTAIAGSIVVNANRLVVLDDPNEGTADTSKGFFNPSSVRGGSWNTNYWSGESTTIRAVALVIDGNGSPKPGIGVNFTLKNPAGVINNTFSSVTNNEGISYYAFNLNGQRYWGYWKIEANSTIDGENVINSTYFVMNFWGCNQCHTNENPGTWGTYSPKSYYTAGYDFHKDQTKSKHTDAMAKGTCIICHQSYNGTPKNWRFTDNTPTINPDNEYSPDWHRGKNKCQDCHEGSNRSMTPQGKNPEIAGCYDTAGCHAKKNTNVTSVNSTTGYVLGGNYKSNYSKVPGNISKAHTLTGITCIVCHSAGHDISKPFNASTTSNTYTENEQCWSCHSIRPNHYGQSCTGCHSQNAHNISSGGGPNCLSCHNSQTPSSTMLVNVTEWASSVHLNIDNTSVDTVNDADCWSCHYNKDMNRENVRKCKYCHTRPKQWHGNANITTNLSELSKY